MHLINKIKRYKHHRLAGRPTDKSVPSPSTLPQTPKSTDLFKGTLGADALLTDRAKVVGERQTLGTLAFQRLLELGRLTLGRGGRLYQAPLEKLVT